MARCESQLDPKPPCMGNVSETPTPTACLKSTAVHLQFVRQYTPHLYRRAFLASKLRRKGNPAIRLPFVLQYASHLYGSTPPICTAVLLQKYWGLGSPERFWLHFRPHNPDIRKFWTLTPETVIHDREANERIFRKLWTTNGSANGKKGAANGKTELQTKKQNQTWKDRIFPNPFPRSSESKTESVSTFNAKNYCSWSWKRLHFLISAWNRFCF